MLQVTTKMEIDITQVSEVNETIEIVKKYCMPAVVVHPELIPELIIKRNARQAKFKIISPVDWPNSKHRGMAKLHNMTVESLDTDGFEIIINTGTHNQIKEEIYILQDFIRNQLSPLSEVRIIIEALSHSKSTIKTICGVFKEVPAVTLIRTDHHTKFQQTKANQQVHKNLTKAIRAQTAIPIKLSGNINSLKVIQNCPAEKYAVNLKQAKQIIKDIQALEDAQIPQE